MRHLVKGRKLGRTASHRKATLMALSAALINNERIVTTLAKAKELRRYIEPLITRSKEDSNHNRKEVFRHLRDKKATSRLFDEIASLVEERPGGYTRIIKLGLRPGDGAEKAMIELVDFSDDQAEVKGKKKRRTRRGGTRKSQEASAGKPVDSKTEPAKSSVTDDEQVKDKVAPEDQKDVSGSDQKESSPQVDPSKTPKKEAEPETKEVEEKPDSPVKKEAEKKDKTEEEPSKKQEEKEIKESKKEDSEKEDSKVAGPETEKKDPEAAADAKPDDKKDVEADEKAGEKADQKADDKPSKS